jgi:phosphoribosylformylglycinamidine synthase
VGEPVAVVVAETLTAAQDAAELVNVEYEERTPVVDLREAVRAGALSSCHDIAEGGFLVAVAEACLAGGLGATLDLGASDDPWTHLFGERPGGFVVSGAREALDELGARVPLDVFGTVGGDALQVAIGGERASWPLAELREAHEALGRFFP